MKKALEYMLDSPELKTLFSAVFPILSSLLTGVFVIQISSPTGIDWKRFYEAWSFYALIGLVVLIYLYNRALYLREREVHKFS